MAKSLALRWTVADGSLEEFEALRLSVWGAFRAFGPDAKYVVSVDGIPVATAKLRAGHMPRQCEFVALSSDLRPMLPSGSGEEWRVVSDRLFPDHYEVSLETDCILWSVPEALRDWMRDAGGRCLVAQDAGPGGRSADSRPLNGHLRGLPPGFDFKRAFETSLRKGQRLTSRADEDALHVDALTSHAPPVVVGLDDVSVCSPFPPHSQSFGRCGAHFCGLDARGLGSDLDEPRVEEAVKEHFHGVRRDLYERVGIKPMGARTAPFDVVVASLPDRSRLAG